MGHSVGSRPQFAVVAIRPHMTCIKMRAAALTLLATNVKRILTDTYVERLHASADHDFAMPSASVNDGAHRISFG